MSLDFFFVLIDLLTLTELLAFFFSISSRLNMLGFACPLIVSVLENFGFDYPEELVVGGGSSGKVGGMVKESFGGGLKNGGTR